MSSSQPLLIIHVIHHLVIGGMENGLVNLVNKMPASKYRHHIVCIEDFSDFRKRITNPDVKIYALHRSQIGIWRLRYRLFRLFSELKPEIVHSRGKSGLDALLPARIAGVRHLIHSEHGWDVDDLYGNNAKNLLLRKIHSPLINRYIAVSKDIARHLEIKVCISPSKISQIYNGVDTDKFFPSSNLKVREIFPEKFCYPDQILIGTIGRAQKIKDQETLLKAYALLLFELPEARDKTKLVIAGAGPLLSMLKALSAELRIDTNTCFLGATEDVATVLRSLDIFVLSSLNEGISNTILEAMATALPVIATSVGGNPELVEEGVTGQLFTTKDERKLCNILREYVSSNDLRQRHGNAAREISLSRYSLNRMVSQYDALYAQTIGASL